MATMDYEQENGRYDDEPRYEQRDRSASPRPSKREDDYPPKREDSYRGGRDRSASPNGRVDSRGPPDRGNDRGDSNARNPGSNLFVTGIHPRLSEAEVSRLFEKYGNVEGCSIMKDPHTQESRGFGFVKMVTAEEADAAKDGLQGENIEGRTLSIEKARRARPRTPTPGKYFGPPKREEDFRGPPRGGRFDRYDDRRGGGGYRGDRGYGGGRYDDSYRGSSRYDDRERRSYGRRDDYGSRGIDRYASGGGRDDRYSSRGDDYRGGGGGGSYGRDEGRSAAYADAPPREAREPYGGGAERSAK
ncbi:transformer-2 protein, partial [Lecanoromycetidae sp. Uapishka_2]